MIPILRGKERFPRPFDARSPIIAQRNTTRQKEGWSTRNQSVSSLVTICKDVQGVNSGTVTRAVFEENALGLCACVIRRADLRGKSRSRPGKFGVHTSWQKENWLSLSEKQHLVR